MFEITPGRLAVSLGAPYALLVFASLSNWAWRALALPGLVAGVSPLAIGSLAAAGVLGFVSMRRGLPLGMITWPPAGLGGLMILATALIATSDADATAGVAILLAYAVFFLIVVALTTALASHGTPLALAFMTFFVLTQTTRFPVFEAEATATLAAPTLLTAAAAARALAEAGVVVWLAHALVHAVAPRDERDEHDPSSDGSGGGGWAPALGLLALTAAHGLVAGWEGPTLEGTLRVSPLLEQAVRWWSLAGIQIGVAFVFIRVRRSWLRDGPDTDLTPGSFLAPEGETTLPLTPSRRAGGRTTGPLLSRIGEGSRERSARRRRRRRR